MKKKLIFVSILFATVFISIYYEINNTAIVTSVYERRIVADYFPNREMIKIFNGGYENSGEIEIIDKVTEDKVQMKIINTATGTVRIYEVTPNKVTLIYSFLSEKNIDLKNDYIDNLKSKEQIDYTEFHSNIDQVVLKGPIKKGAKWENGNSTYKITDINVMIDTAVGRIEAIEITRDRDIAMYYAKGLGLVKVKSLGVSSVRLDSELIEVDYEIEKINQFENLFELIDIYLFKSLN